MQPAGPVALHDEPAAVGRRRVAARRLGGDRRSRAWPGSGPTGRNRSSVDAVRTGRPDSASATPAGGRTCRESAVAAERAETTGNGAAEDGGAGGVGARTRRGRHRPDGPRPRRGRGPDRRLGRPHPAPAGTPAAGGAAPSRPDVAADEVGVARLEAGGASTWRATIRSRTPARGPRSAPPSGRRSGASSSSHAPVMPRRRRRRGPAGTWVYAQVDSVPAGDRVGSAVVIWPTRRNGRRGPARWRSGSR